MELRGKTAIVTGGAVRLGRALALGLAERGANIVLHFNSSETNAQKTADEIQERRVDVEVIQANLENPETAAADLIKKARARFGALEILINSAAIFEAASWQDTTSEIWDRHLNINLKAPFFLSQQFARQAATGDAADSRRHILNIVDWRATRPTAGTEHFAYTIAKNGLAALTEMLAVELGPEIQVNGIAPGAILPPPGKDESHLQQLANNNPLQRVGSPDAIVEAALYLLESDFVTGEILHINGGEHLRA